VEEILMSSAADVSPDVHPDRILSEFSNLWTSMAKEGSPEHADVLRACALTLIVFADEEDDHQAIGETLYELMRSNPNRAIVVKVREAPGTLESRVFAQCWKPPGQGLQICCEQVELTASMNRIDDLPSIVGPVTAPDLPRVVWFRSSRLAGAPDLSRLIVLGDKIVVDSARPGSPSFADLRNLIAGGCIAGDLAWTRLTRLRELLAQILAERDAASVQQIQLDYRGDAPDPQARYLQAWLRLAFAGAAVDLHKGDSHGSGALTAIRVAPDLEVTLDHGCAEYEIGSRRQHSNIAPGGEYRLLAEELSILEHDRVFEAALARMSPWAVRS
jgi:glucose-6-phosphate dehydrogenase assembly protein OpcA